MRLRAATRTECRRSGRRCRRRSSRSRSTPGGPARPPPAGAARRRSRRPTTRRPGSGPGSSSLRSASSSPSALCGSPNGSKTAPRVPRSDTDPIGTAAGVSNRAMSASSSSYRAPTRSILFTNRQVGMRSRVSVRISRRVCTWTPSTAEITSTAPSSTDSARSTSAMKSECPGVSIRLTVRSPSSNDTTAERIVMPRLRSRSIESVWVFPSSTRPTRSITPAAYSSRSVRLVLPASTCATMPIVREFKSPRECVEAISTDEVDHPTAHPGLLPLDRWTTCPDRNSRAHRLRPIFQAVQTLACPHGQPRGCERRDRPSLTQHQPGTTPADTPVDAARLRGLRTPPPGRRHPHADRAVVPAHRPTVQRASRGRSSPSTFDLTPKQSAQP